MNGRLGQITALGIEGSGPTVWSVQFRGVSDLSGERLRGGRVGRGRGAGRGWRMFFRRWRWWGAVVLIAPGLAACAPADVDRDGDVDQEDFGLLQRCYSGSGTAQTDPACLPAQLDGDSDVDAADLQLLA